MSIGFGVYPAAAALNHSCAPNCVLTYGEGAGIRVRTTSGVKRGDELTHAYVNLAAPTRTRRAELHAKYAFTCDCSRCVHGARYVFGGEDVDELMEARRSAHAAFGGPHAACGRPHAAARGGGDGSTSTAMPGGATDVSDPSKPQTSAQDVGGAADDEAGEAIEESVVMLHKASHPSVSRAMRRKYTAAALERAASTVTASHCFATRRRARWSSWHSKTSKRASVVVVAVMAGWRGWREGGRRGRGEPLTGTAPISWQRSAAATRSPF